MTLKDNTAINKKLIPCVITQLSNIKTIVTSFLFKYVWIIVLALINLSFYLGYHLGILISSQEISTLKLDAERALTVAYETHSRLENKALIEREEAVKELTELNQTLFERLKEAYEKDPEANVWANLCLPDSIECLLK